MEKRKRPTPRMGKGATINARVSKETRAALEARTTQTGRSISEVVEAWLEEARRGQASLDGVPFAHILRAMVWAAQSINAQIGDPTRDESAFGVLVGAWSTLVEGGLKAPALSETTLRMTDMQPALLDAAARVSEAIRPLAHTSLRVESMLDNLRHGTAENGWFDAWCWELVAIELNRLDGEEEIGAALAEAEAAKDAITAYADLLRVWSEVRTNNHERGRRFALAFLALPTSFVNVNLSTETSAEAPGD